MAGNQQFRLFTTGHWKKEVARVRRRKTCAWGRSNGMGPRYWCDGVVSSFVMPYIRTKDKLPTHLLVLMTHAKTPSTLSDSDFH